MDQDGAVGFEHEEANGLGQPCGEATRIQNLAASDEQTHRPRTVLSVSDRTEAAPPTIEIG
jgi:hypothetical protein